MNKLPLAFLVLLTLVFFQSCAPHNHLVHKKRSRALPQPKYFADTNNDGIAESIDLSNRPEANQGYQLWMKDFYSSIKYPTAAWKNGIGGIVTLAATINEIGRVEQVEIVSGISQECNEAAKDAIVYASQRGFTPLIIDAKPVKYKMEISVGFWVE